MTKKSLLQTAKDNFKLASQSDYEQRKRERDDLQFQVPEFQWDADAKAQRQGGTVGNQIIPARPMLSISLLHQPMSLVRNQASQAHLGVEIHPVSEDADKDIAEVKQGLYRRIERDSPADQARMWGLDRAIQCGRGWYRVTTKYDEDSDNTDDQEIVIERILHQDMVYADPAATKPDFSDARFMFLAVWLPLDTFKAEFPDAQIAKQGFDFKAAMNDEPGWVMMKGDTQGILVAEYWYKEFERKKGKNGRTIEKVSVKVAKMTGFEVIEESGWNGHYIPIIPVIGRELQPFDGQRRWEGMVRPARDGQKFYNYSASNLVERMALEPKAPWVMAEGQAENHEAEWQMANIRNFAYLEYKPVALGDKPAPPPSRTPMDSSGMSLSLLALQEAKQFVQSATSVYEPSLGEAPKKRDAQSGRAIMALQSQSDAGTSQFISNLASISMRYEALVVLDLMPTIYDRPGRITQVLGGEDETKMVMLNAPFVPGQDGRPVPAQEGQQGAKTYDLSKGRYAISVNVGKSFQTRLQQGQEEIGDILSSDPSLMPLIGATYFKFRDFPGADEIAKILKKVREKNFPGLDDNDQGPTPEQLRAENQALKQKGQEVSQQLQMAADQIKTDQAKQQATIQIAQINAAKEIQLQKMKDATSIAVAQINASVKVGMAATEDENEALATGLQHAHEAEQAELDRGHEAALSAQNAQMPELGQPEPGNIASGNGESV